MANWKEIVQAIQDTQNFGVGNTYDGNIADAIRAFEEVPGGTATTYNQDWRGFIDAAINSGLCSASGASYDASIAGAVRMFQDLSDGEVSNYDYNMAGLLLAIQNANCGAPDPGDYSPMYDFSEGRNSMYLTTF